MKTSDFDYDLPPGLIAQTPIEPRDHSLLLVLNRQDGSIEHRRFFNIVDYLKPGDVMVFIVDSKAGRPLKDQDELAQFVRDHPSWKIEWRIQRDNKLLDPITVQIPASVDAQSATLGVNLQTSVLDAPRVSATEIWGMVVSIPGVFRQLFSGSVPPNSLVGPIGIAQVTGEVAQRAGLLGLLNLLGLLSVNLAVVNLLPFPALDGVHPDARQALFSVDDPRERLVCWQ